MADKTVSKEKTVQTVVPEPEYTVDEFAANAGKIFGKGITSDIVNAAFMVSDIKTTTISKAKEIVKKFITMEVK